MLQKKNWLFVMMAGALAASWVQASPVNQHAQLRALAESVSAQRLRDDVEALVGFGTRHTLSDTKSKTRGIGAARRWLEHRFNVISKNCQGCLKVELLSRKVQGRRIPQPTEVVNVLAILPGTADPSRIIMITGDIDSRASDVMDSTSDAPGANDNASGLAAVLEAAHILSRHRFSATLVFAGLSGEEQGLYGGKILAEEARRRGWRVEAVINNDMIGNIEGIDGVIDNTHARVFSEGTRAVETPEEARQRRFSGGEIDSPSRNLARYMDRLADQYIDNLDVQLIYRLDRFGRGGHHRPFNEAGMPAVRLMEAHENYHRQHQNVRTQDGVRFGDTIDGMDFDYAAKITALNVVTLASLAWAPAPPRHVTIQGAVSPDTTLSWVQPERDQTPLLGYRVYWRDTTSPKWQWMREVGRTNRYTLKNIVIDNYFFGVSSVSRDGYESPVVFPGPMGAFEP